MRRVIPLFLMAMAMAIMISSGCVESVTRIHDRSEGDKALYLRHDPVEAHGHYQKAARSGDAEAQHELAVMYLTGEGVNKDVAYFQKMEEMAAAQEYTPAMRTLGFLLVTGLEGIQSDPRRGMALLKAAADDDDASAHYMLGGIYSSGVHGVQRDYRMAAYHYALAEENGIHVNPELKNAASLERMGGRSLSVTTRAAARPAGGKYDLTALETRKYVQHVLKNLGYYSMSIDGAIGKGSVQAIKAFQKDAGLKPTGRIDEQLIDSLLAAATANNR